MQLIAPGAIPRLAIHKYLDIYINSPQTRCSPGGVVGHSDRLELNLGGCRTYPFEAKTGRRIKSVYRVRIVAGLFNEHYNLKLIVIQGFTTKQR
jgi:hypothetical protein